MDSAEVAAILNAAELLIPALIALYEKLRTNSGSNAQPAAALLADALKNFQAIETKAEAK